MSTFYLCNGTVAGSASELADALKTLSDDDFSHHLNKDKNDFYVWLNDIQPEIASQIRRVKTRKGLISKLGRID